MVLKNGVRRTLPAAVLESWISLRVPHRVCFTRSVFDPCNGTLAGLVQKGEITPARCLFVVDRGLLEGIPVLSDSIRAYASVHSSQLTIEGIEICPGGEACKNDWTTFEKILESIARTGLCRRSYLVAVGGGALLDVAGFAASVAHRGLRLIRIPTTTLSQADSGIGVKNGINRFGQKNFAGTFTVPFGVINDPSFLETLSDRDWRSGFSEAVKVSLIKDGSFFETIEAHAAAVKHRRMEEALPLIRRCAEIHYRHITEGGDPFEQTVARPLDFGHWSAHRMEMMTQGELTHGEAVSIGVALDSIYSAEIGLLPWDQAERICSCLKSLDLPIFHPCLKKTDSLFAGLEEFRRHLGGELTLTLLEGIGCCVESHAVNRAAVQRSAEILAEKDTEISAGSFSRLREPWVE